MKILYLFFLFSFNALAQPFTPSEIKDWEKQSKNVTIIRDYWGVPHVYGKKDADAVFGLMYAQCEDDFFRVEMSYIDKLGRLAEIRGENWIYTDLLTKMIIDTSDAKRDFEKSPLWLKKLMIAFADGINYYLYKNPQVTPALITRFQPWYPLLNTDGSINAINTAGVTEDEIETLYTDNNLEATAFEKAIHPKKQFSVSDLETGSNGFAFAPSVSLTGNAMLYINPHVSFYYRQEMHMVSEEGLNAYGAATWGQFFIYQGFNESCGWMHTSSGTDVADLYAEKLSREKKKWAFDYYEYDNTRLAVGIKQIEVYYKEGSTLASKSFSAMYTHHGPLVAKREGLILALKANNRSLDGLIQSWLRTKAKGFEEFKKVMDIRANTSNNTLYADNKGNIAYWHGNFIPLRDTAYDWSGPVDGKTPDTDWQSLHKLEEIVHIYNPPNGWLQNCNSSPFSAAGKNSPKREDFPPYMAPDGENYRSINALRILNQEKKFTLDKVIAMGYDTYLAAFEKLIPALVDAFEKNFKGNDSVYSFLSQPVILLSNWNMRCDERSVATTLAVEWGQRLLPKIAAMAEDEEEMRDQIIRTNKFIKNATPRDLVNPLIEAVKSLKSRFGKWEIPWGEINRYQRLNSNIYQKFDDKKPSLPISFVSATWGMIPGYTSKAFTNTKKKYGISGNSFVCAVEFGKKIKAKSVLTGGISGDEKSLHFKDQASLYAQGKFKDVYFYTDDLLKHVEKAYNPGQKETVSRMADVMRLLRF